MRGRKLGERALAEYRGDPGYFVPRLLLILGLEALTQPRDNAVDH